MPETEPYSAPHAATDALPPGDACLCTAAILAARNRQEDLSRAIRTGLANGLVWEDYYETFLQCYLFAGFPAAIEALSTLAETMEKLERAIPLRGAAAMEPAEFERRGEVLCRRIYAGAYNKMRERFRRIAPDLDHWMIVEGYGKTLSRAVLSPARRELITIGILAVLGWERQLHSHIRGALLCGARPEACHAVLAIAAEFLTQPERDAALDTYRNVLRRWEQ